MKDLWDLIVTLELEQQMVGVATFSSMYSIIFTQLMVAGHSGHHGLVVQ